MKQFATSCDFTAVLLITSTMSTKLGTHLIEMYELSYSGIAFDPTLFKHLSLQLPSLCNVSYG